MKKLYSFEGKEPTPINALYFSDGSTRTGDDYTKEELKKAGYTGPYTIPEYDAAYQTCTWDSEKLEYVVEDLSDEHFMQEVRNTRNFKLHSTDVLMLEDYPITLELKKDVIAYRQWLRDLPKKIEDGTYSIPKNANQTDELYSEAASAELLTWFKNQN